MDSSTKAFTQALMFVCVALLAACSHQARRNADPEPPSAPVSAPSTPVVESPAPTPPAAAPAAASPSSGQVDGAQFTGVAVCDEYLASYRACRLTLGALSEDVINERVETWRARWQAMARDPTKREELEQQCQNLTAVIQDALGGRKCDAPEADFVQPGD